MTSNLSNLVKIRRKAFSLLKNRSISFRFFFFFFFFFYGVFVFYFGGTTGVNPRSFTSFRVAAPPYALSMIILQPYGGYFQFATSLRPSGPSFALPGERENFSAQSALAATR
jgi:hypothetical protein